MEETTTYLTSPKNPSKKTEPVPSPLHRRGSSLIVFNALFAVFNSAWFLYWTTAGDDDDDLLKVSPFVPSYLALALAAALINETYGPFDDGKRRSCEVPMWVLVTWAIVVSSWRVCSAAPSAVSAAVWAVTGVCVVQCSYGTRYVGHPVSE